MKALTTLFVVGMFLTTPAMADDVDDVKAAVQGYFAALNSGDANAVFQYRIAERSSFNPLGALVTTPTSSLEELHSRGLTMEPKLATKEVLPKPNECWAQAQLSAPAC